jgi:hypothetical protein
MIIGLCVGAAIGFGGTVVADYADDGEIFNGSISAEEYIANTVVAGTIGALTGGAAASTFTLTLPTFGLAATSIGTTALVAGTTTVTISGVAVAGAVAGLGVLGASLSFYEGKKAAPRIHSNSRKKAYQKAFHKGGKKTPIYHPNGKFGPHYHPANPKYKHWHYYFTFLFGFLNSIDD